MITKDKKEEYPNAPYNLYMSNFAEKFKKTISLLIPGNQKMSIDLILSKSLEPIFYNNKLKDEFTSRNIKVSFFELIKIETFGTSEIPMLVVMCSNQESEILSYVKFLNSFSSVYKDKNKDKPCTISFLIYPQASSLSEQLIRNNANEDLKSFLKKNELIESFNYDYCPIDRDLFSLEYNYCFNEMFLTKEKTGMNLCAEAIYKWQILYGRFSNIFYWGNYAKDTLDIYSQIEMDNRNFSFHYSTDFPNLLVVDRSVDTVSCFMTQLSYLGLLDENYGINKGAVYLPKQVTDKTSTSKESSYYNLVSTDLVLPKIENEDFSAITDVIKATIGEIDGIQKIKDIQKDLEITARNAEIIRKKSEIEILLRILERIKPKMFGVVQIEFNKTQDKILRNAKNSFERLREYLQTRPEIENAYRMTFIANVCLSGFTEDQYNILVKEFIQNYGQEAFNDFLRYESAGFIVNLKNRNANRSILTSNNYDKMKFIMKQPDDESDLTPEFAAYYNEHSYNTLFNYNFPTMCYKIHEFMKGNLKDCPIQEYQIRRKDADTPRPADVNTAIKQDDIIYTYAVNPFQKLLSNKELAIQIEMERSLSKMDVPGVSKKTSVKETKPEVKTDKSKKQKKPIEKAEFVIFAVGGLTYNEVCSLRRIAKRLTWKLIICTTGMMRTDTVFKI